MMTVALVAGHAKTTAIAPSTISSAPNATMAPHLS